MARIQGSHHIFTMPGRRERIVIPIHGNQPLKQGLLRSLMKIDGLRDDDLSKASGDRGSRVAAGTAAATARPRATRPCVLAGDSLGR